MIVDFINYLAISAVSFALAAFIWRTVFKTFRNWIDRFLFWGTVVGVAIMFAGWYHVFTGDRSFGRALMLLALVEATAVMVAVNLFAHRAYSKPYDPEQDPEFMAEVAASRQRIAAYRQQYLAEHHPAIEAAAPPIDHQLAVHPVHYVHKVHPAPRLTDRSLP